MQICRQIKILTIIQRKRGDARFCIVGMFLLLTLLLERIYSCCLVGGWDERGSVFLYFFNRLTSGEGFDVSLQAVESVLWCVWVLPLLPTTTYHLRHNVTTSYKHGNSVHNSCSYREWHSPSPWPSPLRVCVCVVVPDGVLKQSNNNIFTILYWPCLETHTQSSLQL